MKIIGHSRCLTYLRSGLKNKNLSPSLFFVGPEGIGKKTVAQELAQSLTCDVSVDDAPADMLTHCGTCKNCVDIQKGQSANVMIVDRNLQAQVLGEKSETQTAVKIESIRRLENFLHLSSFGGKTRIGIIDEADRLSPEAANSMLKILEEPPTGTQLILLASDEHSLPVTIRSRCALLRFAPVAAPALATWLEKTQNADPHTAVLVADRSSGSFSRALYLLSDEQDLAFSNKEIHDIAQSFHKPGFRKDLRKTAEHLLAQWIEKSERVLLSGQPEEAIRLNLFLDSRKQLNHNVAPRLVIDHLALKLEKIK